ncbi:efflux RND transporter permease subunit [Thalassotalea fusca]
MFERIISWSIGNRLLIVILLIAFAVTSYLTIPKLNLDAFPDVTNVQVAINTEAPGLAAEEVEQLITYPIEAVMYAMPNVSQVRSISKTGLSGVTVVFDEGTDIYFARQLVFERLNAAKELIPEGVGVPEMGPNTSGLGQVYQYLLLAEDNSKFDAMTLRSLNDWIVKLLVMPVDGVTDVLSFGGEVKQYQVNVQPNKLLAYQLSQQDVVAAIEDNNTNVGGWYMDRGQEQLVIRGTGWFASDAEGIRQIGSVPLKTVEGAVITVGDVADVSLGSEIRQGAVTMTKRLANGEIKALGEVVSGIVLKRMGANTKATIAGIEQKIDLINQALPQGVRFEPFYDQGELIEKAVNTVVEALLIAFVLIIAVLLLFLMNLRATFLVLISIPISIGLALMVMAWLGISANLMSLGGIAIAIGMLVDGSVVMVENIFKQLSKHPNYSQDDSSHQMNINSIVFVAGKQVARPIFFAALIILVVFMPLFSFEGVEAKLFQPMATSIILAVVAAIFVALAIVPALASLLFRKGFKPKQNSAIARFEAVYQRLLLVAMRFPKVILFTAFGLFGCAVVLAPKIGTEFVPELEEGTINMRVTLAPSSSLTTAIELAPKIEQILMTFPEVEYALSRIGRPEIGGDPEPVNNIEVYIGLKPINEWRSAKNRLLLQQQMAEKLTVFPGLLFNFSQPIATRVDELLSGVKAQLAIKLFGKDLSILAEKGQEIADVVQQIDGAKDVALEQVAGEAQLVISPKRQQLSRYGLAVGDVMAMVQNGVGGVTAGQVISGNERYDIYVRLQHVFRKSPESIADLRIQSPAGAWVRLGDVAHVKFESGPPQVRRDDVQRRVVIQANVEGRDMGNVVADIRQAIAAQVDLPSGYVVKIGGQFESQQRAQQRLIIVIPLSLLLILLLLYFAFASMKQALLIMINVPLAIIGGVFALYFSGQYLSVPSAVGFITLFGVAVLNGVVMVESFNQQLVEGVDKQTAIFDGAVSRLRPVLMTAITSALGLIPMLMSSGVGSEIQRPLATVVIGGLFTATFLTLFVLPVVFNAFTRKTTFAS